MGGLVSALEPLLDAPPVDTAALGQGSLLQQLRALQTLWPLLRAGTFGMLGDPDGNRCLPAPGAGDAPSQGTGSSGAPAGLAGQQACSLPVPKPSRAQAVGPGTAVQISHGLCTPRTGARVAAAPLLRGAHGPHLQGECQQQWHRATSRLPACEGAPPPQAWRSPFLPGQILDQWFESEPLKATLATDAVIGAMASPHTPGSG